MTDTNNKDADGVDMKEEREEEEATEMDVEDEENEEEEEEKEDDDGDDDDNLDDQEEDSDDADDEQEATSRSACPSSSNNSTSGAEDSAEGVHGGLKWPSDGQASDTSDAAASSYVITTTSSTTTTTTTKDPVPSIDPTLLAVAAASAEVVTSSSCNNSGSENSDRKENKTKRTSKDATKAKQDKKKSPASQDKVTKNKKRKEAPQEEAPASPNASSSSDTADGNKRRKSLNETQRRMRNAREQRRSNQICDQFDIIRDILVSAGVIVPKGTKGTILSVAKDYITMLQKKQKQIAMDNCLLIHQMQKMGEGAMGGPAAAAVRQVAARHGATDIIWAGDEAGKTKAVLSSSAVTENLEPAVKRADPRSPTIQSVMDYSSAFQNGPIAMAISSLGGTLVACNDLFCQFTGQSKEDLTGQTVFGLTAKEDLRYAFERLNQWLTPSPSSNGTDQKGNTKLFLRTSSSQDKFRLCLTPIRDYQQANSPLQFLCITLLHDQNKELSKDVPARYSPCIPITVQPKQTQPGPCQPSATMEDDKDEASAPERPRVVAVG